MTNHLVSRIFWYVLVWLEFIHEFLFYSFQCMVCGHSCIHTQLRLLRNNQQQLRDFICTWLQEPYNQACLKSLEHYLDSNTLLFRSRLVLNIHQRQTLSSLALYPCEWYRIHVRPQVPTLNMQWRILFLPQRIFFI